MRIEFTGIISAIVNETSGVSYSGKEWRRGEVLIEGLYSYREQRPPFVAAIAMNETLDEIKQAKLNEKYTFYCNLESREYNGKYYTDVRLKEWKEYGADAPAKTLPEIDLEKPLADQVFDDMPLL